MLYVHACGHIYVLDRGQKRNSLGVRDLIYSDLYAGRSLSAVAVHNSSISLSILESVMLSVFPLGYICLSSNQAKLADGWSYHLFQHSR